MLRTVRKCLNGTKKHSKGFSKFLDALMESFEGQVMALFGVIEDGWIKTGGSGY